MPVDHETLRFKTGLIFCELSLQKKTNIVQNISENIKSLTTVILYHKAVVKQDN
jgi:hypothetical protein